MALDPVLTHYYPLDDFQFTYHLAAGITHADIGKALTFDVTAPNTMKLAGDGNTVHGRLWQVEDRGTGLLVGSVERKFKAKVPVAAGHGIVVGDSVTGAATAGTVKKAAAPNNTTAVEVGLDFVVVEAF